MKKHNDDKILTGLISAKKLLESVNPSSPNPAAFMGRKIGLKEISSAIVFYNQGDYKSCITHLVRFRDMLNVLSKSDGGTSYLTAEDIAKVSEANNLSQKIYSAIKAMHSSGKLNTDSFPKKVNTMKRSKYNYLVAKRRYIDARRRYMDDEVEGKVSKIQSLIDKVKGKLMAASDDPRVKKLLKILKIVGVSVGAIGGAFLAGNLGGKAGLRIAALASIAKEGDGLVKTLSSDTVRNLIGTGTLYACGAIFSLALSVASIAKSRSIGDSSLKLNAKRNRKLPNKSKRRRALMK